METDICQPTVGHQDYAVLWCGCGVPVSAVSAVHLAHAADESVTNDNGGNAACFQILYSILSLLLFSLSLSVLSVINFCGV